MSKFDVARGREARRLWQRTAQLCLARLLVRRARYSLGARGPDGREEDADDGDVVVQHEDVRALEEVRVAEREHELDEVEDDGEDEVGGRDPEEGPDAVVERR